MFQSIQKVFERNVELIGGDCSAKDKARSLVTKMVNALTAASEIGGPMAAMYLLKHPDHYTGHKFRACFWRGYVLEVMQVWEDSKDNITRGPVELEHLNVYDWVRRYHKRPIPKRRRKMVFLQANSNDAYESDEFEDNYHVDEEIPRNLAPSDNDQLEGEEPDHAGNSNDEMSDSEDTKCYGGGRLMPVIPEDDSKDELLLTSKTNAKLEREVHVTIEHQPKANTPSYFDLLAKHPQARTHEVCLLDEKESYVPNFIGGAIPRKDAGSREEYCMTMLTLFKPWRSGKDLRPDGETSWSTIFDSHALTKREKEVMKFFHIRFECNDARDDFSAQRKQAGRGGGNPFNMSNDDMEEIDTQGIER
ncbi:hypothetical protein C8Q80DRAFT_1124594 [Daedaleopsis nitida]|nr:hypothetical protein C8Q80DRAFT_1124594 [Daedaleopsis nitida]